MKVLKSAKRLTSVIARFKKKGKRIGFVPTMGFLHEGHLSLVRKARRENDIVAVSIFVNPTQFGPHEDYRRYPRHRARDTRLLKREGVDYLFVPSRSSIYPSHFRDYVRPGPLARYLCGPKRPGHFRGVATVVKRLFDIVAPYAAYFGEKDYQQARIIESMVKRFQLPVRIKTSPIVREQDGLAMSSRNRYLSREERISARFLYQALLLARKLVRQQGVRDVRRVKQAVQNVLAPHVTKIDYVAIVHPQTLKPLKRVNHSALIALACYVGRTRLIDNMVVRV